MRKILFRGKRIGNIWVYGDLVHLDKGYIIITSSSLTVDDSLSKNNALVYSEEEISVVIPKTIGQFTGLTDKNGKEVFEGDIVRCLEFENNGLPSLEFGERELFTINELKGRKEAEYISEIFYDEANFYVDEDGSCEVPLCCFFGNMKHSSRIYELEVIGNKYDNPELLNQ